LAFFKTREARTVETAPPAVVPLTAYPGLAITPSLSPDGSQVAFSWNGGKGNDYDIYLKLVGEGEPYKVTADPSTRDYRPTWSPDGQFIAFRRVTPGVATELYVVPALGGAERKVATTSQAMFYQVFNILSWSPDSKWLAYSSDLDHPEIWLVKPDGSETRQLTDLGGAPAFSGDGRHMAFIRYGQAGGLTGWVLPLTPDLRAAGPPAQVIPEFPFIRDIAWLPDDRGLIFSSSGHLGLSHLQKVVLAPNRLAAAGPRELPFGENGYTLSAVRRGRLVYSRYERDTNILRLSLTGSDRSIVVPIAPSTLLEHLPDYSPDGTRIAFSSTRTGAEEIYIANADGSNLKKVTSMGGPVCSGARWSPDGQTILFHSGGRESRRQLYLLDVKTGVIRRLTDDSTTATQASWSRDGKAIYYTSDKTGRWQIWRIPATGETPVQVTTQGGNFALESSDGRVLYYAKDVGNRGEIWQMPVGGGTETPLVTTPTLWTFAVARDGLYFVNRANAPPPSIDFLEFATGKRSTVVKLDKPAWLGLAVSPDEKYLLYAVQDSEKSNLMLVDNIQ
jgi:Tol biopolymer transport system component